MGDIRRFDNSIGVCASTSENALPDGEKQQEWADYVCNAKLIRLSVPLVPSPCLDVLSNLSEFSDNSQNSQNRLNDFTLYCMKVPYKIFAIALKSL